MKRANEAARAEGIRIADERQKRSREFLDNCLTANPVAMRGNSRRSSGSLKRNT
jgi:hypothetical protein